jgi:hypothetical protein
VSGYFAPTLKFIDGKSLLISDFYEVNLEKHSAMAELIQYLIERRAEGATLAEIQMDVWQESIKAQGWQQKIRNAVMRVRDLCPYTIAPILIHNERLRFFSRAIAVVRDEFDALPVDARVKTALKKESLSSQQLAEKINVSLATAKRLLKKMTTDNQVVVLKEGRNVVYRAP